MQETKNTKNLLDTINRAISDKKGKEIVNIDLSGIENSVCAVFVICHASSDVHVNSIADNVVKKVKEELSETVYSKEGYKTSNWILLDYIDIVVHVFQENYREFYDLEGLWADADIKKVES